MELNVICIFVFDGINIRCELLYEKKKFEYCNVYQLVVIQFIDIYKMIDILNIFN